MINNDDNSETRRTRENWNALSISDVPVARRKKLIDNRERGSPLAKLSRQL